MECYGSTEKQGEEGDIEMIKLYHGSYTIIEHPLVSVGRKELDFGPGFYLTRLKDQAERWARRVCVIKIVTTPYISYYQFEDSHLYEEIKIKVLGKYDIEWLEFIVSSRKGDRPWAEYDIIEGGVANDQVIDTVEDYYAGRITADQAIGQLKFAKPTHQICIRNQGVVDSLLHFSGSEILKEEGGR